MTLVFVYGTLKQGFPNAATKAAARKRAIKKAVKWRAKKKI